MDDHTRGATLVPTRGDPAGWRAGGRREHATPWTSAEHRARTYDAGDFHGSDDCLENVWSSETGSYRHRPGVGQPASSA